MDAQNLTSENENETSLDTSTIAVLLMGRLRESVKRRPAATLAGAAGVGYVLGGGIPDFVLRLGAAAAVRVLTQKVAAQLLSGDEQTNQPH